MKTFSLVLALALAGCAETSVRPSAPGEPDSEALVVTYYYLNF
ncbi:MAG: hypothetical protein Q8S33_15930 [Myxococcales bacterium]|nr:hypothetical protein [Myxococcales bacterium]